MLCSVGFLFSYTSTDVRKILIGFQLALFKFQHAMSVENESQGCSNAALSTAFNRHIPPLIFNNMGLFQNCGGTLFNIRGKQLPKDFTQGPG